MFNIELAFAAAGVAITIVWAVLFMCRMGKQHSGREKEKAELKTVSNENGNVVNRSDFLEFADKLCAVSKAWAITSKDLADPRYENPAPNYRPPMGSGREEPRPRSCKNCGAPLRGNECEYCGTVFSFGNDVDAVLDVDTVASAVRRYVYEEDGNGRAVRRFNPVTSLYEWVVENPAKGVSTPALPTKHKRG